VQDRIQTLLGVGFVGVGLSSLDGGCLFVGAGDDQAGLTLHPAHDVAVQFEVVFHIVAVELVVVFDWLTVLDAVNPAVSFLQLSPSQCGLVFAQLVQVAFNPVVVFEQSKRVVRVEVLLVGRLEDILRV